MEIAMFDDFEDAVHMHFPGYIVYCYTNLVNGKKYVGVTGQGSISARAKGSDKYVGSSHINAAIKKYGWDAFKKEIYYYGCTKEEAGEIEKDLIAYYDLTNPKNGYNIQKGGLSAGGLSEEGRQRLVDLNSGGASPVAKPIVAFSCDGKRIKEFDCIRDAEREYGLQTLCKDLKPGSHTRGGMIFRLKEDVGDADLLPPDECKQPYDMSMFVGANAHHVSPVVLFDKHSGKRVAEFGCAKDASEFAGVNVTDCMRGVSKTCGDYICYRAEDVVGVDVLPDLGKHKPLPNGKKVIQYSLDGNYIAEYESSREAERATGISYKAIHQCVSHKSHSSGGYVWRFVGDPYTKPKTTWESRFDLGKSNSKPVDQIDLSTGEVIATYPSMAEAARTVGSHKESIQAVASHRRGCVSAAGYGWRYHSE